MKRLFRIDESEKNRILGMHKSATSRQYLKEEDEPDNQTDAGDGASEENATDQLSTQETYDCGEVEEYLKDANVKKWIDNLKVNRWVVQKGTEVYDDRAGYEGAKKVIAVIQCKLEMEPDGIFGDDTKDKVEAFQVENDLTKDGKVGKKTIAKLFETQSETDTEQTPSANECYMNYGEEVVIPQNYQDSAKAARKKDNKNFIFFEDGTVIILEGNQFMGGNQDSATHLWRCNGNDVEFFKKVNFN